MQECSGGLECVGDKVRRGHGVLATVGCDERPGHEFWQLWSCSHEVGLRPGQIDLIIDSLGFCFSRC